MIDQRVVKNNIVTGPVQSKRVAVPIKNFAACSGELDIRRRGGVGKIIIFLSVYDLPLEQPQRKGAENSQQNQSTDNVTAISKEFFQGEVLLSEGQKRRSFRRLNQHGKSTVEVEGNGGKNQRIGNTRQIMIYQCIHRFFIFVQHIIKYPLQQHDER